VDVISERARISALRQRLEAAMLDLRQEETFGRELVTQKQDLMHVNAELAGRVEHTEHTCAMMQDLLQWEEFVLKEQEDVEDSRSEDVMRLARQHHLRAVRGRALQHAYHENEAMRAALTANEAVVVQLEQALELSRLQQESAASAAEQEAERLRQELQHYDALWKAGHRSQVNAHLNIFSVLLVCCLHLSFYRHYHHPHHHPFLSRRRRRPPHKPR
jgi:hypothetical protein